MGARSTTCRYRAASEVDSGLAVRARMRSGVVVVTPNGAGANSPGRNAAIEVSDLRMRYGDYEAVRGLDLRVEHGEVFAFLGPNGAGKTTTCEILEGFRHRTGGEVAVLGCDPAQAGPAWRARIGVVLQESAP